MQKFIVERDLPDHASQLSVAELQELSRKSTQIMSTMDAKMQWVESFVTANKIYCVVLADSIDTIYLHADLTGFPIKHIEPIKTVLNQKQWPCPDLCPV